MSACSGFSTLQQQRQAGRQAAPYGTVPQSSPLTSCYALAMRTAVTGATQTSTRLLSFQPFPENRAS